MIPNLLRCIRHIRFTVVINYDMSKISSNNRSAIRTLVGIMICLIALVEGPGQSSNIAPPPDSPIDSTYLKLIASQEYQRQVKIDEFLTLIKSSCLTATNHSKFILQLTISKDGSNDGYLVIAGDSTDKSSNQNIQICISGKLEDPELNFGSIDFISTARRRPGRVQYTLPLN